MTAPAHQRDLTIGPVAKTLLLFALPSLGVNILQSLNHSVNSVWIGQFLGEEALAASANAGLIMFLMFSTLFGFTMATTILIGQNMAAVMWNLSAVSWAPHSAFSLPRALSRRRRVGSLRPTCCA